jgi:hypothetical protein
MSGYLHLWFNLDVTAYVQSLKHPSFHGLNAAPMVSQMIEDVGNRFIRQNVSEPFQMTLRPSVDFNIGEKIGEVTMTMSNGTGMYDLAKRKMAAAPGGFTFAFDLPSYTLKHPETISRLLKGTFDQIARKLDAHALSPQPFPWKFEDVSGQPVGQIEAGALQWLTPPKMLAFEGSFTRDTQQQLNVTVHAANKQEAEELLRQAATADADWVEDDFVGKPELHTISEGMEIVPVAPNPNEQALHAMLNRPCFDVTLRRTVVQEITYRVDADEAATPEAARAAAESIMAQGDSQAFEGRSALGVETLWESVSMDRAEVVGVEEFKGFDAAPTLDEAVCDVGLPRPGA